VLPAQTTLQLLSSLPAAPNSNANRNMNGDLALHTQLSEPGYFILAAHPSFAQNAKDYLLEKAQNTRTMNPTNGEAKYM